ncbi:MAG TPA: suppressor of fused domain protein [Solirubrobacteraceae bacterium]|nr:suppressor of fused domain protein [Solirubrobacteraceae bacterium]
MGFAEHLERHFPDGSHAVIAPVRADVEDRLPAFRVWRIAPAEAGQPWIYATCGAAQSAPEGGVGAEYVLLSPEQAPVLVEMLAALAKVNAEAEEGLGVGSVIALGRPWLQGSFANHLLVVPPYGFEPGFDVYDDEEAGRRVVVLWLLPITAAEAQFARENGHEALEKLIEDSRANVAHPLRPSLV